VVRFWILDFRFWILDCIFCRCPDAQERNKFEIDAQIAALKTANPKSKIANPKSQIANPKSKLGELDNVQCKFVAYLIALLIARLTHLQYAKYAGYVCILCAIPH
jgi:hypothetical protein